MVPAMAQKTFGSAKYTAMCSYYGESITGNITAYEAGDTAGKVVKDIMSVIGLKANFELRAANVPNAAAVILKNKRYILYNPKFMDNINSATGNKWAAISILAHEIGHHLNGHTLDNVGSRPQTELEADEFSGFVLRKMGASLADAQSAMSLIAKMKGSHTHPAKNDRLAYIATGWKSAGEYNPDNTDVADNSSPSPVITKQPAVAQRPVAVKQPVVVKTSQPAVKPELTKREKIQQSIMSGRNIASDAHLNSNPNGQYYLTTKGNLVQVTDENVYLIASLERSDRPGYKLMLDDKGSGSDMYIGAGGVLVNGSGKRIGYLRSR
ncbi:membrane-binding protein [Flavobacterium album]|uniref:Membrane-binding protein n=2 Tax=Flavobacterium album TaxID=2175091 RepID=A0A2S1QY60_9FLAO|nr:membrane-binding protein [Flavobacterium album]